MILSCALGPSNHSLHLYFYDFLRLFSSLSSLPSKANALLTRHQRATNRIRGCLYPASRALAPTVVHLIAPRSVPWTPELYDHAERLKLKMRPPVVPKYTEDEVHGFSANPKHKVIIRHPGYASEGDTLLTLPAFDKRIGGLHYDTARVACGIIAGNRWDGYFARDTEGEDTDLGHTSDGILPVGVYYFHFKDRDGSLRPHCLATKALLMSCSLGSVEKNYPIVPTFSQWAFPHAKLPPEWESTPSSSSNLPPTSSRSNTTTALAIRYGGLCRMSFHSEACEKAHLCPVSENDWFHSQKMQNYIEDPGKTGDMAVYDVNNMIPLRADLHKSFDDRKFVFVPKDREMVVHMLWPSSELSLLYQNSRLHPMDSVPREYIFTRFAWALFPMLEGFLQGNEERLLLSTNVREGPYLAPAAECKALASRKSARSRNSSPTKRARVDSQDAPRDEEGLILAVGGIDTRKRKRDLDSQQDDLDVCPARVYTKIPCIPSASTTWPRQISRAKGPCTDKHPSPATIDTSTQSSISLASVPPTFADSPSPTPHTLRSPAGSAATPITWTAPQRKSSQDFPPTASEAGRLNTLRQQGLERERKRSDRDGRWKQDLAWARQYLTQPSAEEGAMRRLWDILGIRGDGEG